MGKKFDYEIEKFQKLNIYESFGVNLICSMFKFNKFPKECYPDKFMQQLIQGDTVFFKKPNGEHTVLHGHYAGSNLNDYGIGDKFLAGAMNGNWYELNVDDVSIVRLNFLGNSELPNIRRFSRMLTEVDISQNILIEASRNMDVVVGRSSKLIDMLKDLFKNKKDGKPYTVTSDDFRIGDINGIPPVERIQLNDPESIKNMQALSDYSNELRKRAFFMYGMPLNYNGKKAQQNDIEVSRDMSVSWIIPLRWYDALVDWCNDINEKFGLETSVEFSAMWKLEFNNLMAALEVRDLNEDEMIEDEEITLNLDQEEAAEEEEGAEEDEKDI